MPPLDDRDPAAQFEPFLTKHVRECDIGPVRAVTSKVSDVLDTVIAIAREVRPARRGLCRPG
jgi:hypothetical protein